MAEGNAPALPKSETRKRFPSKGTVGTRCAVSDKRMGRDAARPYPSDTPTRFLESLKSLEVIFAADKSAGLGGKPVSIADLG